MMRTLLSPTDQRHVPCPLLKILYSLPVIFQYIQHITLIIHFLFEMNIFERLKLAQILSINLI